MKLKWRWTIVFLILSEILIGLWVRIIQPACEPCPPPSVDYYCPPCISHDQYRWMGVMVLLPAVVLIAHAIVAWRKGRY